MLDSEQVQQMQIQFLHWPVPVIRYCEHNINGNMWWQRSHRITIEHLRQCCLALLCASSHEVTCSCAPWTLKSSSSAVCALILPVVLHFWTKRTSILTHLSLFLFDGHGAANAPIIFETDAFVLECRRISKLTQAQNCDDTTLWMNEIPFTHTENTYGLTIHNSKFEVHTRRALFETDAYAA